MKCPHCKYIHGWDLNENKKIHGKEGDFFSLPIEMKRESMGFYCSDETVNVYACPACNKLFINH